MNRVERELARSAGLHSVKPGDRVWVKSDWMFVPAEQGIKVMEAFLQAGYSTMAHPERIVIYSRQQKELPGQAKDMGSLCRRFGIHWFDCQTDFVYGELAQAFSLQKGTVVAGIERNGIHFGALGLISLTVSTRELGVALATGKVEWIIPETVYIDISGNFPSGSQVLDVSRHLYSMFDQDGLTGKAVIAGGSGLQKMNREEWPILTGGIQSMGGEIGLIAVDGPRGQVEKVVKVKAEDIIMNRDQA